MLNTKALSELLTKNVHPKLCPSLFAMSPKGSLVAYSVPANIKQVRDQAALISMTLNDTALQPSESQDPVEILTVQVDSRNIIAKRVRPDLFVVLVGSLPPHNSTSFKVNAERPGDARFPAQRESDSDDLGEVLRQTQDLQRARLDAICGFVQSELGSGVE